MALLDNVNRNVLAEIMCYNRCAPLHCIKCGVEECDDCAVSDEHGFCSFCLCDLVNQARELRKQLDFLGVNDIDILMAEFAAYKVAELKKTG